MKEKKYFTYFQNLKLGPYEFSSVTNSSAGGNSNALCDVPSQSLNLSSNDSHSHQNIFGYVCFICDLLPGNVKLALDEEPIGTTSNGCDFEGDERVASS